MSVVIPVRVPREVAQKIRELVDAGMYPNRSSLVREALRRFMVSEGMSTQKTALRKFAATLVSIMISWEEKAVTDVILFGSAARGEATVESDIDLLVLVENAEGWMVRQRLYDLIYPVIPALGVDVSLIVMDKKVFIHMAEEGDPFALSIVREGAQLQGSFLDEYSEGTFGKSR
ncbi:nucleotidyltransferase domain-containing protein [Candidatus Bathyarchaeota archaeon]|nr:nucleotidyltransferase domain-containing protein [Candidatus Bathyarchaeota archaeon]